MKGTLRLFAKLIFVTTTLIVIPLSRAGDRPHNTLTIDGMTVPDIGPLLSSGPKGSMNPNDAAKVTLGKQLYFDGRLSKNGAIACAFCHNPGTGWADPRQTSIGIGGGLGGRQAPTVLNTGFNSLQFWDGRARSLEEQALIPIQNPIEMGETHENIVRKLNGIKGYQQQFRTVFGTNPNLQGGVAEAIAAFERTVISVNSAFDKYAMGDAKAMDEAAVRGLALFKGKARCIFCHNGPNFTDNQFHNLGVPQIGPMKEDLGRYYVTKLEKDKGAFKTPTLRSIAETRRPQALHQKALSSRFRSLPIDRLRKSVGRPLICPYADESTRRRPIRPHQQRVKPYSRVREPTHQPRPGLDLAGIRLCQRDR